MRLHNSYEFYKKVKKYFNTQALLFLTGQHFCLTLKCYLGLQCKVSSIGDPGDFGPDPVPTCAKKNFLQYESFSKYK
jgi:hypothetical protein